MKLSAADELSRKKRQYIFGIKVLQVNRKLFTQFRQFHAGMVAYYEQQIRSACPTFRDQKMVSYTAYFASFARKSQTNNKRIKNANDTMLLAKQMGLHKYISTHSILPKDASLALLATSYAVNNFYAPKTIEDKVYGHSPFTNPQRGQYPFTSLTINEIKSVRVVEHPVGVVLGKDILDIFNSTLNPIIYRL